MSGVVLVTGGTGKTGQRLVMLLGHAGVPYRIASRHGGPPFDWTDPASWGPALDDVGSIYLVAPPTLSDPYLRMLEFLDMARARGVARFVLLSMASLPAGGPAHGLVHQWLIDHVADWAVLRPSAFMQNFSEGPYLESIRSEGAFYSNTGEGRVGFIDATDIARAAFVTLTAPRPVNDDFVLTGGTTISYDQVAEIISSATGRRITHTHISTEELTERFLRRGLPDATAQLLAAAYATIADGAADLTTSDLARLTGRPPITFEEFARANARVWEPRR